MIEEKKLTSIKRNGIRSCEQTMKKKLKFFFYLLVYPHFVLPIFNITLGSSILSCTYTVNNRTKMQLYAFIQPLWYVFIVAYFSFFRYSFLHSISSFSIRKFSPASLCEWVHFHVLLSIQCICSTEKHSSFNNILISFVWLLS